MEKIYENALARELCEAGLVVKQQYDIAVYYRGVAVGAYTADLLVENCVLVELKAVKAFDTVHEVQCMNYLKAAGLPLCLLLNFGRPRVEIKRLVNGLQPNAVYLRSSAFICGLILQSEQPHDAAVSSAWTSKYPVAHGYRWRSALPAPA